MSKLKKIMSSWRVWLLLLFLLLSVWTISPSLGEQGVLIKGVDQDSSAALNGVISGETLIMLNDKSISTIDDYNSAIQNINPGDLINIETEQGPYSFVAEGNETTIIGINVDQPPASNLKAGLDIVGGVRVLLSPEDELTTQQMNDVLSITKKRLNVYGLSDIVVRQVSDLEANQYILVEIAGASQEEVVDLIGRQGKFEAKIANESVFVGGTDIKQVCRSADCSGVRSCDQVDTNEWACQFMFAVTVSPESAKKHAEITSGLSIITQNGQQYLSEKLDLFLDDELVDSLFISSDLQGQESTTFTIQGPGRGTDRATALDDAISNMNRQQTLLITGSLPVKLDIAKMDIISPSLGQEFLRSAMIAFLGAILAVGSIVFIRYRKIKIAVPIMFTIFAEILIILGVAAAIRWNLDLAAIAAILASIGTGVDHQIVITDETLATKDAELSNWKDKLKRAFFIIMAAYFTIVVAMLPLWAMGAGLLKGFAIITIIGVSIGVFITRPAYAKIIEILFE